MLTIVGVESMSRALFPGQHKITLSYKEQQDGCGLIPIYGKTQIKTKGFKWDLDVNMPLEMGGLVSSSNKMLTRVVEIIIPEKSNPLLWVTHLKESLE